jgi:hypothetical protein
MTNTDTQRSSIKKIDKVIINEKAYYEKKNIEAVLYTGCRTIKKFIQFNNIQEHEHIRASLKEGVWVPGRYPYNTRDDKLFVTIDAALEIIKLDEIRHNSKRIGPTNKAVSKARTSAKSSKKTKSVHNEEPDDDEYVVEEPDEDEDIDEEVELEVVAKKRKQTKIPKPLVPKRGFVKPPAILHLEQSELFRDIDDEVINIQVRGERDIDECYYLASDVAKGYGIKRIEEKMLDTKGFYRYGDHFVYFMIRKKKVLYLKYPGLTRLLYGANNRNVDKFMRWANKTLFTVAYGTPKAKKALAADLIGMDPRELLEVFKKKNCNIACIYLFLVGGDAVADTLGQTLKSGNRVYKFGMTKNIAKRISEHLNTYGKMKGATFRLAYFVYVDPDELTVAEGDIRTFFKNSDTKMFIDPLAKKTQNKKDEKELVVFSNTFLDAVKVEYDRTGEIHQGTNTKLRNDVKTIRNVHTSEIARLKVKHLKAISSLEKKHKNELDACRKETEVKLKSKDKELDACRKKIEVVSEKADAKLEKMEAKFDKAEAELEKIEAENKRLRKELHALQKKR